MNNEKNLNNFLNKLQSKFNIRGFCFLVIYKFNSSAPIVPIGPSTTDFQFDQKSSSIDQFMIGHGFNSEISQNKQMTNNFDNNPSHDNLKSQQITSNQLTSSDNSLGKKVKFFKIFFQK